MILAVNVGNSSTAFGICRDDDWLGHWRIRTVHERMPDEYSLLFERFLHRLDLEAEDIDRLVVASVVPQVTEMIVQIGTGDFGHEPLVLGPGVETGIRIGTDLVATVQLSRPPAAIGKNTIHSIQSGIIFGYVGMVEALVDRIKAELSGKVQVAATGGQADIIAPLTDRIDTVEPWLNLDGLRLVSERNPLR